MGIFLWTQFNVLSSCEVVLKQIYTKGISLSLGHTFLFGFASVVIEGFFFLVIFWPLSFFLYCKASKHRVWVRCVCQPAHTRDATHHTHSLTRAQQDIINSDQIKHTHKNKQQNKTKQKQNSSRSSRVLYPLFTSIISNEKICLQILFYIV